MPGADLTVITEQIMQASGSDTEVFVNMHSTPEDVVVDANFPLTVTSDGSLIPINGKKTLDTVHSILGENLLSFLHDSGIQISFCDFSERASLRQLHPNTEARSALDYMATPQGVYDHHNRMIFINSQFSNTDDLTYTLIHEIGHAVNFMIQNNANVRTSFFAASDAARNPEGVHAAEITGAQNDYFFLTLQSSTNGSGFPSVYGSSNTAEWFAEMFAMTMLEHAQRFDLIRAKIDFNPGAEYSTFLVDPIGSLMISKIIETINNRATDPESYAGLMQSGIDARLWVECDDYFFKHGGEKAYDAAVKELTTDRTQPSPSLQAYQTSWKTVRLQDIYAKPAQRLPSFEDTVRHEFQLRVIGRSTMRDYLPDANGDYFVKPYALRYTDFKAIHIACVIKSKKTREDKAKVLFDNGIHNQESLDYFLKTLTVLSPEEVEPYLNPNDLISEVSIFYEQALDEQDKWLSGEDE